MSTFSRDNQVENGAQIDVIIDRADNTINLCEVKYCEDLYSLDKEGMYSDQIIAKVDMDTLFS